MTQPDPTSGPATGTTPPQGDQQQTPGSTWPGLVPPGVHAPGFDASAIEERSKAFGREVEQAANRIARDPFVGGVADTAARLWGLVLLAIGVWFLADVTLGMALPSVRWNDFWPLALIAVGLFVVVRGMTRRGA